MGAMPCSPSTSLLETLLQRSSVVECLIDGVENKRDIEAELDVSRPTIDRAMRSLEDAGLVVTRGSTCELTRYGRLAYGAYRSLVDEFDSLYRARGLLVGRPGNGAIERRAVVDSTVYVADQKAPFETFKLVEDRIADADVLQGSFPVVVPHYLETIERRVTDSDLVVELLFEEELRDVLDRRYRTMHRTVRESDGSTIGLVPSLPSFTLLVVDRTEIWIGTFRDGGSPRGVLRNRSPEAVDWATETFECIRNTALQERVTAKRADVGSVESAGVDGD